jgi:hypothetical protein
MTEGGVNLIHGQLLQAACPQKVADGLVNTTKEGWGKRKEQCKVPKFGEGKGLKGKAIGEESGEGTAAPQAKGGLEAVEDMVPREL